MPELPEVETVRKGLSPFLAGVRIEQVIVRQARLRFALPKDFAALLEGRKIISLERRAKYLLWRLADTESLEEAILVAHLGMSGRFLIEENPLPEEALNKHDHVLFITNHGVMIRYQDPRRFGFMDYCAASALAQNAFLAHLGPEPLGTDFTPEYLQLRLAGRRGAIKPALLDQRLVAGIGNIYACEALWRARVSPLRPAGTLSKKQTKDLVAALRAVLHEALEAGGSSLRDFRQTNGELGYFQHRFQVYEQAGKPCPACSCKLDETGGIKRLVQAGRSSYYCPSLQG